mgnify:CR=1 FL=1
MDKIGDNCENGKSRASKGAPSDMDFKKYKALQLEERVALIQELIPLGLMAVAQELNDEVEQLVSKGPDGKQMARRYGYNPGTVRLGGRLLPVDVPRVRGEDGEISLKSYQLLHGHPNLEAENILKRVIAGASTRKVERTLPESTGSIGVSKSSVSRKLVKATQQRLEEFEARRFDSDIFIALFLDGISFGDAQMIIAAGVKTDGSKKILGFVQSGSENGAVVSQLLRDLNARGFNAPHGLLVVIDGSKGIYKAVKDVYGSRALIQRCQWHKRENVVACLAKTEQRAMRKLIQKAYDRPTYKEASAALKDIKDQLFKSNITAFRSLEEGFEDTLQLHKIDMFKLFSGSFKTTNIIESINSKVREICHNVDNWTNSSQKFRWLATALLEIELGFRRIFGYKNLPRLVEAVEKHTKE